MTSHTSRKIALITVTPKGLLALTSENQALTAAGRGISDISIEDEGAVVVDLSHLTRDMVEEILTRGPQPDATLPIMQGLNKRPEDVSHSDRIGVGIWAMAWSHTFPGVARVGLVVGGRVMWEPGTADVRATQPMARA